MEFPDQQFDTMTEADVREDIITPLLVHLGYRRGTEHNIIREQSLIYDREQLGRRKATDPLLRGRADYICEAGLKVRWVVEAKAPSAPLDMETEAQAWSYAKHPEVRAVYFLLTNGRQFKLHRTDRAPQEPPVLDVSYEQLPDNLQLLVNLLGPLELIRAFPDAVIDRGVPLGPGLRSIARVSGGRTKVDRMEPNIAPVHELVTTIVGGHAQRGHHGGIIVAYQTQSSIESLQVFNETVGLNSIVFMSQDQVLSADPLKPNVFVAGKECVILRGTPTFDINTWTPGEMAFDARVRTVIEATGFLSGLTFRGTFVSTMRMQVIQAAQELQPMFFNVAGTFEFHVT